MNHLKIWKMPKRIFKSEPVVFRRWSNKRWAVLASFHKVVIIGTLCFSYNMLAQDSPAAMPDTSRVSMLVELEEVETSAEQPSDLEHISMKPVVLVNSREIRHGAATSHEGVLRQLPGVDIRQRGMHGVQADLSIQGGSFDQSMVLLNGIDLSDPQTGHFQLNLPVDLRSVSRMEIVTGSASRSFGTNAFSGIVNVVTRPSDSTHFGAGVRLGQHRYYNAHLSSNLSGDRLSTLAGISTSGSDGYRENTDFRTTQAFIHSTAGKGKVEAHIMAGMNHRAFGANAFYTPLFPFQYEETTTAFTALKTALNGTRTKFELNGYLRLNRDHFLLDRSDPTFYRNDHRTSVSGSDLNGRISWKAGVTHTGIHFRQEKINSTSLGVEVDPQDIVLIRDGISLTHGHSRNQFNLNLNHTFETGPMTISGGVMMHMNSDLDFHPWFFPGMDLRFRLPYHSWFYASLNHSMRLPTFTDLYYQGPSNIGNPELVPEKATTIETGLYRKEERWHAGVNGFYRKGSDMIDWIWQEDGKWHTLNLTRIDALGGDLQAGINNMAAGHPWFLLEAGTVSYTFVHLTRVSDQVNSRYLLDNLRHKVTAGAVCRLFGDTRISLVSIFQDRNGGYMATDPETGTAHEEPYDPFLRLDVKVIQRFGFIHLFVEVTNLTGVAYQDLGHVIQPGRWIMAGLEIR